MSGTGRPGQGRTPPAATCAVVGAGRCGSAVASQLAACGLFDRVVLADATAGSAEGRALDIEHASCIEGFTARTLGTTVNCLDDYRAIAGSQIVVIAVGLSRRPGMQRADLLEANIEAVAAAAAGVRAFAPQAVVIVVTNPLDEMTAFVQAVSGLPTRRVIGQAGILDSARFRCAVARELDVPPAAVRAVVLGPHSEDMVPLVSTCRVRGVPLTELLPVERIKKVVELTRDGGTEIIGLLRSGSTSVAPSAAVLAMVRAVVTDSGAQMPVCTSLHGAYGVHGVCVGVEATLGLPGVTAVIERAIAPDERCALRIAADCAREQQSAVRERAGALRR
jgi:malate dehydrogenase